MKTKETSENTIFRKVSDHIGQMLIAHAEAEIARLEKENPPTKWRKDFSVYLEDDDFYNGAVKLKDGYCWVVRDYKKEKSLKDNTIFRTMNDHAGQCPISEAKYEIERMEKLKPSTKWRKDFTPFLMDDDSNIPERS